MLNIIHLSDLHIGCIEGHGTISLKDRFDLITNNLLMGIENHQKYVIIVTGDIVHNANKNDFTHAKNAFDELEKQGYRVLIVPGNHDYRVKEGYSGNITSSPNARDLFCQVFYGADSSFPKNEIIENINPDTGHVERVAFIGVDSDAGQLEGSKGKIGNQQLGALDSVLDSDEIKQCEVKVVYLHHNPFFHLIRTRWAMKLIDKKDFIKLLEKHNVSLVLFGHTHTNSIKLNKKKIPLALDGGTATGRGNNKTPIRIFDFLTVDYDDIEDFEKDDIKTRFQYLSENW